MMEKRGEEFLEETLRMGRIWDLLMKTDKIKSDFEKVVVGNV